MSLAAFPAPSPEALAQRAERLNAEARAVALDAFAQAYADLVRAAQALGSCAELEPLPTGLREISRQTVGWLDGQLLSIDALRVKLRP
jgi:hypothetical protein